MRLLLPATLVFSVITASAIAFAAADYTIIKYGNNDIKYSEVQSTWQKLFPGGNAPDFNNFDENIRQNVLRGLVAEKLLYQEALKAGFDKSKEVERRLQELRRQIVLQTYMESKMDKMASEADLKKAYAEKVKKTEGIEEVKARHILVKTEDEAKKIAGEIKNGADFNQLARERSADKGSGAQGGDLGWFTKDKMVPEFADAAFSLKKGEVSDPVKSGFGWHIIKLEDRRGVKPATFEASKEELKSEVVEKAVEDYITSLIKEANVKYYDENGKALPFEIKPTGAPIPGQE